MPTLGTGGGADAAAGGGGAAVSGERGQVIGPPCGRRPHPPHRPHGQLGTSGCEHGPQHLCVQTCLFNCLLEYHLACSTLWSVCMCDAWSQNCYCLAGKHVVSRWLPKPLETSSKWLRWLFLVFWEKAAWAWRLPGPAARTRRGSRRAAIPTDLSASRVDAALHQLLVLGASVRLREQTASCITRAALNTSSAPNLQQMCR